MLIGLAKHTVELQARPKLVNKHLVPTGMNPLLAGEETQQSAMCPCLLAKFVPDAETNSGLGNNAWKQAR